MRKTVYTITVDIPTQIGACVRRKMYLGSLKDREAVKDAMKAKGYRVSTNIEHIYTVEDALAAVGVEERFNARAFA